MNKDHPLAAALAKADLIHDQVALMAAIHRMAQDITRDLSGRQPVFLTVMNGGLIIGGHLALALPFDCEFDYCHATRYRGGTSGGTLDWIKAPRMALAGRDVLLVDDILDEGYTLRAVRDYCAGQGANSVRIAVLCRKVHDRVAPGIAADYIGVEVPDRYVFGFGMDYHEQGRNLPGIWAL
jgi:hypoxanthine phosphoribosyltransferase